jgi:dihydrofolate reductase
MLYPLIFGIGERFFRNGNLLPKLAATSDILMSLDDFVTCNHRRLPMRKIVAGLFISLDGVVEAPETWHLPYFNDEMGEAIGAQMAAADAMLLGRVTYQEFASYWPQQAGDEPFGDFMNNSTKYVVSTTLDSVDGWQNSTLIGGNVVEEITKLKQQPGKNIVISGSGTLIRSLLRDHLLDELNLLVHPIVVGSGKRLFPDGNEQTPLKLVDAKTFSSGVLALTYQPADTRDNESGYEQQRVNRVH